MNTVSKAQINKFSERNFFNSDWFKCHCKKRVNKNNIETHVQSCPLLYNMINQERV